MSSHFKLLARFLIGMRRSLDCNFLNTSRQWNRANDFRSATTNSLNNFPYRLIQYTVVKASQPNSYTLVDFHFFTPTVTINRLFFRPRFP